MRELLNSAAELVRRVGDTIKSQRVSFSSINNARDIKSEADLYSETILIKGLNDLTDIPILSEEAGPNREPEQGEMHWIIDPLDGTMNFTRIFPISCISVALWMDEQPVMGIIYDFNHGNLYSGIVGESARCNGSAISVSTVSDPSQAVLATGFPVSRSYDSPALIRFVNQVKQFKKTRMIGSAAMSLAYVASAVFDIYYEEDIMIWDVAAGLAIISAAGGGILFKPGLKPYSVNCIATNKKLISSIQNSVF